jgi:hypothetical protein
MPSQLTRAKKRVTSSSTRDYSGISGRKGPKVLKLSEMQEQKGQLDERQKKAKNSKFFITFCEDTSIDFIPTALTAVLRQKNR